MNSPKILFESIKKFYEKGHGFHTLRFPNGFTIKGKWDMSIVLEHFKIPKDLSGKKVLEIGPANGYFSFEMSKRGANVVAIDLHRDWWSEEINQLMSANVKFKVQDIRTLDESFGKFDIVFSANVLQHNKDIIGNMERIRKVTKEKAIISIGIMEDSRLNDLPLALLVGNFRTLTTGKKVGTFWRPNMVCFKKIAQIAGFKKVEEISTYTISNEDGKNKFLGGVIHCHV